MTHVMIIIGLIGVTYYLIARGTTPEKTRPHEDLESWFKKQSGPFRSAQDRGRMLRCHNCGCFFPQAHLVIKVIEGNRLHFCSKDCRDNFRYP